MMRKKGKLNNDFMLGIKKDVFLLFIDYKLCRFCGSNNDANRSYLSYRKA